MSTLSRRTFAKMSAGSLVTGGTTFSASAQTPDATPELDGYSPLLDRLDVVDPQTTLDMVLSGDQHANVVTVALYVVILASDDILADGAYTNSFDAQRRALQHAIGLISHLDDVLRASNLP